MENHTYKSFVQSISKYILYSDKRLLPNKIEINYDDVKKKSQLL